MIPSTAFVQNSIDLALLILLFEGIGLSLYRSQTGRGLAIPTVFFISISGIGLLLALRAAIIGAEAYWILLCLSLGGIAHAIDLIKRLKSECRTQ